MNSCSLCMGQRSDRPIVVLGFINEDLLKQKVEKCCSNCNNFYAHELCFLKYISADIHQCYFCEGKLNKYYNNDRILPLILSLEYSHTIFSNVLNQLKTYKPSPKKLHVIITKNGDLKNPFQIVQEDVNCLILNIKEYL